MVIEVCQLRSARELEPKRFSKLCFGPSFASAQLARALRGFLSRPTCLPPGLAGGPTANSSLQLHPNKSWSRIPVNCGRARAVPRPSLADSARESLSLAAEATVSPSLDSDSTGKECLATNLSFQGLSLAEPTWASGKFKSESIMS
jgi:hypothetical protein